MFTKVLGAFSSLVGAILCTYGWANYQLSISDSFSAVQISQLANQATVNILGGIGLMVFGLALVITVVLNEVNVGMKAMAATTPRAEMGPKAVDSSAL